MESKKTESSNSSVLQLNGLRYKILQPLSTSLSRSHQKQFSQRQQYSDGEEIVFDLNVSSFTDPELSFMTFKVQSIGANSGFGSGSATNLFRDVTITSKNGAEVDRVQLCNVVNYNRQAYETDASTLVAESAMTGFNGGNANVLVASPVEFCVPLSHISGLFRPLVKGTKIPPHLLAGSRLSISLETFSRALFSAGACTGYTITNPTLTLMSHTLNDNTMKAISIEAQNGLEYSYPRTFVSSEASTNLSYTTQVKKAVSQATSVTTVVCPTASQNSIASDSFLSIVNPVATTSFQYRIGSTYMPQQVVTSNKETYMITKAAYDSSRNKSITTASHADFQTGGKYCVSVPLRSDGDISSSGLAINSSATIELNYTGDTVDKSYYIIMSHVGLARAFLGAVSVKI